MERSDANQRISVWCLRPHPCIVDSTQKARLEEMPGICPGSAENLVELLLLLGLCSIHFAMHGVPMLVSIASGPLGLSGRCACLFFSSMLLLLRLQAFGVLLMRWPIVERQGHRCNIDIRKHDAVAGQIKFMVMVQEALIVEPRKEHIIAVLYHCTWTRRDSPPAYTK